MATQAPPAAAACSDTIYSAINFWKREVVVHNDCNSTQKRLPPCPYLNSVGHSVVELVPANVRVARDICGNKMGVRDAPYNTA
jgi:hypothetical protein